MRYIPLTGADREAMLREIGVQSIDDLFRSIPASSRKKSAPELPAAKTESELLGYFHALAQKNLPNGEKWLSFLGGGAYDHFVPTIVDALSSRGEFLTAYTPYQPEVSQGTLQAIFEFQSLVANLFGLDCANASMYDGASAAAEAVLMAMRIKDGNRIFLSKGLHPEYQQVIRAYLRETEVEIVELELDASGRTVLPTLPTGTLAGVISQPNFFGVIENLSPLADSVHAGGGLLITATPEGMAFGAIRDPGSEGADIVAGEGQSFGNYLNYGGPYVGLLATKREYVRQIPGRLVGRTVDREGKEGYVLTLATREQHIRREKATSNICTNHSLCALRACIYLATVGERGLREIALRNMWAAHKLRTSLLELKGVEAVYKGPVFNEFTVRLPISTEAFLSKMEAEKVLGGIPISKWDQARTHDLLIAVTETKSPDDLDRYVAAARKAL
ncbi:MAG: aminomethyl-transferring glycine dehydrogenase subunit GcvPA [Pseudomonadota bacterium]